MFVSQHNESVSLNCNDIQWDWCHVFQKKRTTEKGSFSLEWNPKKRNMTQSKMGWRDQDEKKADYVRFHVIPWLCIEDLELIDFWGYAGGVSVYCFPKWGNIFCLDRRGSLCHLRHQCYKWQFSTIWPSVPPYKSLHTHFYTLDNNTFFCVSRFPKSLLPFPSLCNQAIEMPLKTHFDLWQPSLHPNKETLIKQFICLISSWMLLVSFWIVAWTLTNPFPPSFR